MKRRSHGVLAVFLIAVTLISGCSAASGGSRAANASTPADQPGAASPSAASDTTSASSFAAGTDASGAPAFRDAVFHADAAVSGNGAEIDLSAVSEGYVAVRAQNDRKLKCQIVFSETKYTYALPGDNTPIICPLQSGNGSYTVRVMQNTTENKYIEIFSASTQVTMDSEFEPFLRPNQHSHYTEDSLCVAEAARIAEGAANEAELVSGIYAYIAENVDYDYDKAQWVIDNNIKGYLPDPDDTFTTGKGICYDYAALAAAMLRSQGIPTKLVIGHMQNGETEAYHAWNMIWLEETGWIAPEIGVQAHTWQRIDLTFAAAESGSNTNDGKIYFDEQFF